MSEMHSVEDQAVLQALEALEASAPLEDVDLSEEGAAALEVLASLPYALEPVAPLPETRGRLLAAVRNQAQAPGAVTRAAIASGVGAREFPAPLPATEERIPSWAKALAAGLVAAVVGLGFFSLHLNDSLELQREEIASLTRATMVGHMEAEARSENLLDLGADPRFTAIQISGAKLFPVAGRGGANAHGAVFVCAKHNRWYLRLSGLEPASSGQTHKLWFITDSGPVLVSPLDIRSGETLEVSSDLMPADTRGIYISLESTSEIEEAPDPRQIVAEGREVIEV